MACYNPTSIANYFIYRSKEDKVDMDIIKLLKLVYIAHGVHLAINNEALINSPVQAWKYGPVIPELYREIKNSGKKFTNNPLPMYKFQKEELSRLVKEDTKTLKILNDVWTHYSKYTGMELSSITHQSNTPWDITWNHNGGSEKRGADISNALIKEHYSKIVRVKEHASV